MNEGTVSVPDEQYERLAALAAARGVSPETQLARLIDDAYEGFDVDAARSETLPLGVYGDDEDADAGTSEDADTGEGMDTDDSG